MYWDYIRVETLLGLQSGLEDSDANLSNDEVLFITIHQIDELWFKLVLRELVSVRTLFAQTPVPEQSLASAVRGIRRMALIIQKATDHFSLMETMTTRDYLAFRDKLYPASGFQSAQMREIEILLGLRSEERIGLGHEHSFVDALRGPGGEESPAYRRVKARLDDRPTLRETLNAWLFRTPIQGSTPCDPDDEQVVTEFIEEYLAAQRRELEAQREVAVALATTEKDRQRLIERYAAEVESTRAFMWAEDEPPEQRRELSRVRAALVFIESYRELPLLAWPREVVEGVVALEQAFTVFRQRHARMVERVIGRRTGTGGSAGVEYLDQTALRYRVFRDFWAVRTMLVRRAALPPLRNAAHYDFAENKM